MIFTGMFACCKGSSTLVMRYEKPVNLIGKGTEGQLLVQRYFEFVQERCCCRCTTLGRREPGQLESIMSCESQMRSRWTAERQQRKLGPLTCEWTCQAMRPGSDNARNHSWFSPRLHAFFRKRRLSMSNIWLRRYPRLEGRLSSSQSPFTHG